MKSELDFISNYANSRSMGVFLCKNLGGILMGFIQSYLSLEMELKRKDNEELQILVFILKHLKEFTHQILDVLMFWSKKRRIKRLILKLESALETLHKTDTVIDLGEKNVALGLLSMDNLSITMYEQLDTFKYFRVLIHEVAHLVHYSLDADFENLTEKEFEIVAEATSFILSDFYSVGNKHFSAYYIKRFKGDSELLFKYRSMILAIVGIIFETLES